MFCFLQFLKAFIANDMLNPAGVLLSLNWINTNFYQLKGQKLMFLVDPFSNLLTRLVK